MTAMTSHEHNHNHGHHHADAAAISPARFRFVTLLNLVITIAEFIGGIVSGSLALLSDAVHNLSDTASILISYYAFRIAGRKRDSSHTFGYQRAEILAAFINAVTLAVICVFLVIEAIKRFYNPSPVKGQVMLIVAAIGLISNLVSVLLLHSGAKANLNVRSSYLHLLGDTISSVGVILGGIAIIVWKVYWIDPLITLLVALYIAKESAGIIRRSVHIMMQGAPETSLPELQKDLLALPGVQNVHHAHIWMLNDRSIHFEAHIDVDDNLLSDLAPLVDEINRRLAANHGIDHVTIQFECGRCQNKDLLYQKDPE